LLGWDAPSSTDSSISDAIPAPAFHIHRTIVVKRSAAISTTDPSKTSNSGPSTTPQTNAMIAATPTLATKAMIVPPKTYCLRSSLLVFLRYESMIAIISAASMPSLREMIIGAIIIVRHV
jgi:hypothetical protein